MVSKNKAIILAILIPLMFGFLFWGGGYSGSGAYLGLRSSNKVYSPYFLSSSGIFGSVSFYSRPVYRPSYQPLNFNVFSSFRWNFFDP